jgi:hypothetical protein
MRVRAESRERKRPRRKSSAPEANNVEAENLLLRVYVPADRIYAAEMHKFLGLFRDWLIEVRGQGIRQSGYRTPAGEMFEFYADSPIPQAVLRQEFDIFSHLLELCARTPSRAVDFLGATQIGRASSEELVDRFGREYRHLKMSLKQERERRMLTLRHTLEGELMAGDVDLTDVAATQLDLLIDPLVPDPSAPSAFPSLAGSPPRDPVSSSLAAGRDGYAAGRDFNDNSEASVTISPQIINTMQYLVIQNVRGDENIGPNARELFSLIDRFGGQDTFTLKSAVYEFEDGNAPPDNRKKSRKKILGFLRQLGGKAEDVAINVLERYVESKLGF